MTTAAVPRFDFSGGALCLDFVNTLGDRPRNHEEHLRGWSDVAAWAGQAGLLSREDGARLARRRGQGDDAAFRILVGLRETVYRVFSAVAADRPPAERDLAALNAAIAEALTHSRVEPHGEKFIWGWTRPGAPLDRIRWAVARSAADLLVSPDRADVRECASGTCSWLFLDRSPTRRRRWCSMKTCGNRAKVRRFYERQRKES